MTHYLVRLGVDITDATAQDELFGGPMPMLTVQLKEDPIDNVNQGQPATWNFKVDYFDTADQAVVDIFRCWSARLCQRTW